MSRKPNSRIFLCHNSNDKPEVEKIYAFLKARGASPFMDKHDFESFRTWEDKLRERILSIEVAAVFIGKSGLGPWQTKEIDLFEERLTNDPRFNVGLVVLPGCSEELLDYAETRWEFLQKRQRINFYQSDPDPVEELIKVSRCEIRSTLNSDKENLEIERDNRNLRKEIFEMVADSFQDELIRLNQVVRQEKNRIGKIQRKMAEISLKLEKELDPSLKEATEVLKQNISSLARKACQNVLMDYPQFHTEQRSEIDRKRIKWFEREIEKYLLRVHTSLLTTSNKMLNQPMEHKSKLDSSAYVSALSLVKTSLGKFSIDREAYSIVSQKIEALIEIVETR
jgi:hypothetical protein